MSTIIVRPERSFEQFSRGLELITTIKAMWAKHATAPRTPLDHVLDEMDLMEEFDLDILEWLYWVDMARQVESVQLHVTRVADGAVYGHQATHCDPNGCNAAHDAYYPDIDGAELRAGDVYPKEEG